MIRDHAEPIRRPAPEEVFAPQWPAGVQSRKHYRIPCDDKGRGGNCWFQVLVADDGDVHLSAMEIRENGDGSPMPSVRIRTFQGGGRHGRTRQALLWLAEAIRLDRLDDPSLDKYEETP